MAAGTPPPKKYVSAYSKLSKLLKHCAANLVG